MDKGYIIPHTHWDREWRYPLWENRMYLVRLLDELLDILDRDKDYASFLFDGQTVSILDYLEMRPQNEERLKRHVRDGKLLVGPWYTLPDLYPVSGESLVRNLLKGTQIAEKLGKCMYIGYESFGWGQTAQFPQIYAGFGIDTVLVAKHVDKSRAPDCEFIWKGADGTEILATRLGEDARANFFMNAYLQIMNDIPYKSDNYRYRGGIQGMVYHQADEKGYIQDYFLLEQSESIHDEQILDAFMCAWKGMDCTLLPKHRPLMDGSDSTSAQPHLTEMISRINEALCKAGLDIEVKSSSLEEYVTLLKTIPRDQLHIVEGELRDGPATSLSANALMTRPYLKILNKAAQSALFRCAEPFSVAATGWGPPPERSFLDKAIDYLLLSHPHDSINGVTQDKTADDVLYMLNQSLELSNTVYNAACGRIMQQIDTSSFSENDILLAVFNPLPVEANDIIKVSIDTPVESSIWDFSIEEPDGTSAEIQQISRQETVVPVSDPYARPWPYYADRHSVYMAANHIPAGGYKVYRVKANSRFNRLAEYWPPTRKTAGNEISKSGTTMENEHLFVTVEPNGTLTILNKSTGALYSNLNYFEDEGDCGDYWMYYPPYHNRTYSSKGCAANIYTRDNGPLSATIVAEITLSLPTHALRPMNGIKGESRRSEETTNLPIRIEYTLKKGAQAVAVGLFIRNTAEDHRLRVLFDTGITEGDAYSAGHFHVDQRGRLPLRDGQNHYYCELTTQPMQDFVSLNDGKVGFGIASDSMLEYEARTNVEGTLALTLFRAVRNIICTEMRSGGHFPDQNGGQCLRELVYHYAICPYTGGFEESSLYRHANQLAVPLKAVQTCRQLGKGKLPLQFSFYKLSGELELSALKYRETGEGIILRVFNPYAKTVEGALTLDKSIASATPLHLNETVLSADHADFTATIIDGRLELTVPPKKIVTVLLMVKE